MKTLYAAFAAFAVLFLLSLPAKAQDKGPIKMWIYYCLNELPACSQSAWLNTQTGPVKEDLRYKTMEFCMLDRQHQYDLFTIANEALYYPVGNQCKNGGASY